MEERDVEAFSAAAGSLVDNAATFFLNFSEGVSYAVLDGESDVLDAATTAVLFDKFGDCAVFGSAFEELNLCLTDLEEGGANFLVSYFFDGEAFETEHVFIERDCLFERRYGDADVLNV